MSKNVFISWSGEPSRKVASLLYAWLPRFVQSIDPFLSSEDIRKGARWFIEISNELEQINFGILCVTRSNLDAPWLLFEGGALSKSLGHSRVSPLLINISNSDLQGPLAQFNTTALTGKDVKQLLQSINLHLGERKIPSDLLDAAFNLGWPEFEKELTETLADLEPTIVAKSERSERDVLDELLQLTRNIAQQVLSSPSDDIDVGRLLKVSSPEEASNLISRLADLTDHEKRLKLMDVVSHELLTPIVSIKSNVSFLQRRVQEVSPEALQLKFFDILADCESLLLQVDQLRYVLGQSPFESKSELVLVFSDVVLKTISQLQPILREKGFDLSNIEYSQGDVRRIRVVAHKAWLRQAVQILLLNAIYYAEDDPEEFRIRISVDDVSDYFIIRFQDWGIGIVDGLEEKIFEAGFRSPEAHQSHVTGSGLGLAIARKVTRDGGGDLTLTNHRKPTEFQLTLPKNLKANKAIPLHDESSDS
jgi:signal transduction histidine kinase